MKLQHLLPILAAAFGFAFAWALKPSKAPEAATPTVKQTTPAPPVRTNPGRERYNNRGTIAGSHSKEVNAGDFPLITQAQKGVKTKAEGKMRRLSEALGLSYDQEGKIIAAMEKVKQETNEQQAAALQDMTKRESTPKNATLEEMSKAGKNLEAALGQILTQQQLAKLDELRVRERENCAEARAQRSLAQVIENVDLSPDQREEVLARLRQFAKAEIQAIPASATLLLNTSLMPTDPKNDLSVDSVLQLVRLTEQTDTSGDFDAAYNRMLQQTQEELESRLSCYDGVLTAGQMSQLYAGMQEQFSTLSDIQKRRESLPPPKPRAALAPAPSQQDVPRP